jgi:hypothetical protein
VANTVRELHIEVNQRLQEVASHKKDKYYPEEIDLALNKAQFRLLEKGVANRFEGDEVNLSHVSALISKNRISEVIIPTTADINYEDNNKSVYTMTPPDLFWLINGRAEIVTDPINCETAPNLATQSVLESVAVLPFPSGGASPYFQNFSISSSTYGTLYSAPAELASGILSSTSYFTIVSNVLDVLYKQPVIKCYWERYRNSYYRNSFVIVAPSSLGIVTLSSSAGTAAIPATNTSYTGFNRAAIANLTNKGVKLVPTKTTQEDMLYQSLRQNAYYDTGKDEVLLDQIFDYFILYRKESFIVTRFTYDYIRKPRTISLALNQSCELATSTHPKLVDLTVEILRLDTKDQAYIQTVQDTQLRTK